MLTTEKNQGQRFQKRISKIVVDNLTEEIFSLLCLCRAYEHPFERNIKQLIRRYGFEVFRELQAEIVLLGKKTSDLRMFKRRIASYDRLYRLRWSKSRIRLTKQCNDHGDYIDCGRIYCGKHKVAHSYDVGTHRVFFCESCNGRWLSDPCENPDCDACVNRPSSSIKWEEQLRNNG